MTEVGARVYYGIAELAHLSCHDLQVCDQARAKLLDDQSRERREAEQALRERVEQERREQQESERVLLVEKLKEAAELPSCLSCGSRVSYNPDRFKDLPSAYTVKKLGEQRGDAVICRECVEVEERRRGQAVMAGKPVPTPAKPSPPAQKPDTSPQQDRFEIIELD